jgi:hypothetical protein
MHVRIRYPANPEGLKRVTRDFRVELVLSADDAAEIVDDGVIDLSRIVRSVLPRFRVNEVAICELELLAFDLRPLTELPTEEVLS